jgi:Family of unknown function (DUF6452)
VIFSTGCFSEPDCIVTAATAIKIDFKQTKTDSRTLLKSVVDSSLNLDYVKVSGIVDSSYIKKVKATSVTLPIDPNKKVVTYIFKRSSASGAISQIDSIQFSFANESKVIAPKCGAYTFFLDLKVTATSFGETKYKLTSNRLLKGITNVQVFF